MTRFIVISCVVAGLVVAGGGVSNAASHSGSGSVVESNTSQQMRASIHGEIRGPVPQDWIDWSHVIHIYNSRQECITAGQALADAYRTTLQCQESDSGSWVLFYT